MYQPPSETVGDTAAKDEARRLIAGFKPSASVLGEPSTGAESVPPPFNVQSLTIFKFFIIIILLLFFIIIIIIIIINHYHYYYYYYYYYIYEVDIQIIERVRRNYKLQIIVGRVILLFLFLYLYFLIFYFYYK